MAFNDGVKIAPVAYIGLVSVLVTLVIVMALQVLYFQQHNKITAAALAAAGSPPELAELTARQSTALTQRGYVDRRRGVVAIGIDRAMELVLKDLANGKTPDEVIGPLPPAPVDAAAPSAKAAADKGGPVNAEVEAKEPPKETPAAETEEPKDAGQS